MMREFTGDQTIYVNIYFTKNQKYTDRHKDTNQMDKIALILNVNQSYVKFCLYAVKQNVNTFLEYLHNFTLSYVVLIKRKT